MNDPAYDPEHAESLVLAFDVGGTTIKAAAVDEEGNLVLRASRASTRGPAILDDIVAVADELRERLGDRAAHVRAAGAAMPGIVDAQRGIAVRSVNLDLHDLDVAGPLTERLAVPVGVGHDVSVAGRAIAAVSPHPDPLVVVLGTGIAAVLVVAGKVVTGISGQAGELGHVVVRPGGAPCLCGNRGCLEALAGAGAIVRAYEAETGTQIDGAHVVVERSASDPVAARIWGEATSALADGLLTASALLAPGAILLAGGLSEAGDALLAPVREAMLERRHLMPAPPVLVSELGSASGTHGAAMLARDALAADIARRGTARVRP